MDLRITRFVDKYLGKTLCYSVSLFDKLLVFTKNTKNPEIKKILLIKFWGLGNIVLATPTIKAIRKKYPDAEIHFITLQENKTLAESIKEIDKIIPIELKSFFKFFKDFTILIFKSRKNRYNLVIDFEQFARSSSLLTYLTGANLRVGFNTPKQSRGPLYNIQVEYNNDQHIVETFFDLATAIGCEKTELNLIKLKTKTEEKDFVDLFLVQNNLCDKKIIGIHTGTGPNAPTRRWSLENYSKLINSLIKDNSVAILLTGSKSEHIDAQKVLNNIQTVHKENCKNICGMFTIPQLAYLMEHFKLFISSDTGPLHLAAAQKVPTISFYGPNTPKIYGPWGDSNIIIYKNLPCSPCMSNYNDKLSKCIHPQPYCITTICPEEVLRKIKENNLI